MTEVKPVKVISPKVFGLIMTGVLVVLIVAYANYFRTFYFSRGHGAAHPYPYYLATASAAWFGIWLLWLYYRRSKGFPYSPKAPGGAPERN
jgi:hypothetical protein